MNTFVRIVWISCCVAVATARGAEPPRHRFLAVDNGKNLLLRVDQVEPARSWTTPIPPESRDLQLLPSDGPDAESVLVSHGNGAAEYDLATGRPLPWRVARYAQIQSVVRLPGGTTLLCDVHGTLYHLDAAGAETGRFPADVKLNCRLMRPVDKEHVLLAGAEPRALFLLTLQGKLVQRVPLPDGAKGYKAVRLPNGHFMASTGDLCKIAEIDAKGTILSYVGGKKEHPSLGLDFCSGWDVLPGGNRVMANWLGHGKQGRGVHLAEFTPDNKLVWQWADHVLARQITNVKVIE